MGIMIDDSHVRLEDMRWNSLEKEDEEIDFKIEYITR